MWRKNDPSKILACDMVEPIIGFFFFWIWRNYLIEILVITIFIQSLIIRRCKPPSKLIKVLLIKAIREINKIEGICQTHQKNIYTFFQMLQKNKNSLSPSPPYSGKGFFFFLKNQLIKTILSTKDHTPIPPGQSKTTKCCHGW